MGLSSHGDDLQEEWWLVLVFANMFVCVCNVMQCMECCYCFVMVVIYEFEKFFHSKLITHDTQNPFGELPNLIVLGCSNTGVAPLGVTN